MGWLRSRVLLCKKRKRIGTRIKLVVLVIKNMFLGKLIVKKTRSRKRKTYFKTITGDLADENEAIPWCGLT